MGGNRGSYFCRQMFIHKSMYTAYAHVYRHKICNRLFSWTYYFLRHSLARSILNSGRLTKPSAFSSWTEREIKDFKKRKKYVNGWRRRLNVKGIFWFISIWHISHKCSYYDQLDIYFALLLRGTVNHPVAVILKHKAWLQGNFYTVFAPFVFVTGHQHSYFKNMRSSY